MLVIHLLALAVSLWATGCSYGDRRARQRSTHSSRVYTAAREASGASSASRKAAHDFWEKKKKNEQQQQKKSMYFLASSRHWLCKQLCPVRVSGVSYGPSARSPRVLPAPSSLGWSGVNTSRPRARQAGRARGTVTSRGFAGSSGRRRSFVTQGRKRTSSAHGSAVWGSFASQQK